MLIRSMVKEDYEQVKSLWNSIKGFSIKAVDDSKESIERFLDRNQNTSVVAVIENKIVGTILCGHDGRCGYLYHVCVGEQYRNRGIAHAMLSKAIEELKLQKITKISLYSFKKNQIGNHFWKSCGWKTKEDACYYEWVLDQNNKTTVVG